MKYFYSLIFIFSFNCFAILNKTPCASSIAAKIKEVNPDADISRISPFYEAICDGIIEHFKTNAIINTTGTTTVVSGSSVGPHPTISTGTIQ